MSRLWYRRPASVWEEALPLGNGRLGAMVFGNIEAERIQVNEESVWYGGKKDRINPDAAYELPKIKSLVREGHIQEVQRLMGVALTGCPNSQNPYQTLGDLKFHFSHEGILVEAGESPELARVTMDEDNLDYCRSLDLSTGICKVEYSVLDVRYEREYFISKPADCLMMKMTASKPGSISFRLKLDRWYFFKGVKKVYGTDDKVNGICMYGTPGEDADPFMMMAKACVKGGTLQVLGETLIVENADEAVLYFGALTGFERLNANYVSLERELCEHLEQVMTRDYCELKKEHVADHKSLYDRAQLAFSSGREGEFDKLPTDERLKRVAEGGTDIGLQKALFDYGRYLMIAGSREGTLPTTLQGLWNQDFMPPWGAKYTININTEMNYWPAETCNLSECHLPLFELLKRMLPDGRETARKMYRVRGFVAHHNTDIHGDCAPQDLWYPATYWPMGAAWLCTHLWTHYEYTLDKEFLELAFPIMAESALFFVDYLEPWGEYYVTNPSSSPENTYILPSGERGCVCLGPTMDNQILRDLFTMCLKARDIVGEKALKGQIIDCPDVHGLMEQIEEKLSKLAPTKIGSDGRILEWLEEYEEAEPGHRHISQLYGLYPSEQITMDGTPELAAAASKTLQERLSHGGGHTGWSRAWIMNHYAKLWDGEAAYDNIQKMLAQSTYPNLFDKHPPFQIDGNFGAAAAIAQMLVQSNAQRVVLLPALPKAWENGSVKGLRLVGNASLDMCWEKGALKECAITAGSDYSSRLKYGEKQCFVEIKSGETVRISCESLM